MGRQELPNLSLLNKVVLLIALRYVVRELIAHICHPVHTSHTQFSSLQVSWQRTTRNGTADLQGVISSQLAEFTRNPPFLPCLPRILTGDCLPTETHIHLPVTT